MPYMEKIWVRLMQITNLLSSLILSNPDLSTLSKVRTNLRACAIVVNLPEVLCKKVFCADKLLVNVDQCFVSLVC